MNTIKSYKELLLEEERIETEIQLSKDFIEENIKSYLKPSNLFSFLEKKVEKEDNQSFSGDFKLKKYLVGLSLDFLYNKVSDKLLTSKDEKDEGIDWKLIVKSYADQIYIGNKIAVTDAVSEFIDQNIEKLKK
ncbi:hypothetical protein ERX46_04790 [Brumimicrobium glaciale]|jgi:hypothetical protein|uniref:Uncharacterized protein n=1 Tax=Brumimicrobium glaciale TaxID=200475 RepID=A0A4Q4KQ55_9FLAO|nr:hypothetical protein [Brumimicrobium glaciale]RYM34694.1 hypothetical protein ERX46_04790 [Brumimicrobium glaciale]